MDAKKVIYLVLAISALSFGMASPLSALEMKVLEDRYKVNFYGFINPAVTWDSRGSKGVDWAFADPNADHEEHAYGVNVRNTRFGLDLSTLVEDGIQAGGKAELDFVDGQEDGGFPKSIRIRHMYADVDVMGLNFLVGQTWTFVHQIEPATLNTTNLFGQGHIYDRVPQVRITKEIDGFRFALQALTQQQGLGALVGPGAAASSIKFDQPNWQLEAHYRVGDGPLKGAIVGIGGSIGSVLVETSAGTDHVAHRAVAAEGYVPFRVGPVTLSLAAKGWIGKGAGYGTAADQFAVVDALGEPESIDSIGGFIDGGVALGKLSFHAIYGVDDPDNTVNGVPVDRKHNWTFVTNLSYALTKAVDVGVEFQRVETKFRSGLSDNSEDSNNRVLGAVFFKW